jgi:N-methylhydantoinase A
VTPTGRFTVAVDIGGTFTDCVVLREDGPPVVAKSFSTPPDFARGIVDVIGVAAGEIGLETAELLAATSLFLHSTTIAENALVDGTLAPAALLTTHGHEDTLGIMRGGYGRWSGLTDDEKRNVIETEKPAPVIARDQIHGIGERVDSRGRILREPSDAEVEAAVEAAVAGGAEALGICFLWSFGNPANEDRVRDVVLRMYPDLFVTVSHEVAPILGEYERTSSVALNSRLGPPVRRYLEELRERLQGAGFAGTLLVMQANGGLLPFDAAASRPVGMLESGPVAGIVGAATQARAMGLTNVIAADMGGTTFKAGVVRDGMLEYQREPMVLRYHYALPKMDVVSLGLAGGSIIRFDERRGLPMIGPDSAGSTPGPVCYGRGGTEPTITDVDAILGYLNPEFFVGGRAGLDIEKALETFTEKVADPMGLSALDAAAGVYKLANSMFHDLLHRLTVQRGIDPRKYALFSFGGTAGMHVAAYALDLGVDPVVIPHGASVQGAYGLATSDVVHEDQVTRPMRAPGDVAAIAETYRGLREKVVAQLREDGFGDDAISLTHSLDLSYRRQVHIITVPLEVPEGGDVDEDVIERGIDRFEAMYREKYGPGSGYRDAGVELVTYRVRGSGALARLPEPVAEAAGADPSAALVEHRLAWVADEGQMREVPGYAFDRLHHGNEVRGPAIVWTPLTTVVLSPSHLARVDEHNNLVMHRVEPAGVPEPAAAATEKGDR